MASFRCFLEQAGNVVKGEKRKRASDIEDDDDRADIKVPRSTNTRFPGHHSTAKPTESPHSFSVAEQALTPAPAAGRTRKNAPPHRGPSTPPAPRSAASRQDFKTPTRNVFTEYHSTLPKLPPTPPETPPESSTVYNPSPSRGSSLIERLNNPNVTPKLEFTEECVRLGRMPKQRNESYIENRRLQDDCERLQKELMEQKKRHQKEIAEQEKRHRKALAEQQERLLTERDSEQAEYSQQKLEAAEKEITMERRAKEDLQKELTSKCVATKDLEENLATVQQEKQNLNKEHTQQVQNLSAKHQTAQKEKQGLSKELAVERKEKQDLSQTLATERQEKQNLSKKLATEKEKGRNHDQQLQKAMKERDEIENRTIELAKHHVLIGLFRIYSEDTEISLFKLENVAPSLHQNFFDLIDGRISYQELKIQVQEYYEGHPEEQAKIFGDGNGAVTMGNSQSQGTQTKSDPFQGSVHGAGSLGQPSQGPQSVIQNPFGPGSRASGSIPQQPSPIGVPASHAPGSIPQSSSQMEGVVSAEAPFPPSSMGVVETPDQHKICSFILRPGGCKKIGQCNFSHPGDVGCPIPVEAVNNLHEALSKKHSSTAEYISSSYKAVVGLIKNALQASLNRANRIIFLKMMQYHIEEKLCKTIEAASPDVICDSKLPADELVDIASALDEWFGKEFRMPEEMGTIPGSLRKIASCIAGDSPAPVFQQVHDGIPRETASVQSSRPQRNPQQSRFANSSNQHFSHRPRSSAPSGNATVPGPASKLLQDLNGILGIDNENHSSSRHASRSRRPGNPAHGSSSNFPPRHQLSLLNRNPFGSSGGAHPPRIVSNHNEHSALGRVNGPRVDTHVHRQPPRGPRLQWIPAPSANNSHAQARQNNATHRRNVNSSQPRVHVLPD